MSEQTTPEYKVLHVKNGYVQAIVFPWEHVPSYGEPVPVPGDTVVSVGDAWPPREDAPKSEQVPLVTEKPAKQKKADKAE